MDIIDFIIAVENGNISEALIRPIQVFKQFDPEDYLEYCTEEGETPTQEGFRQFLGSEIPKDFEILDNS